MVNKFRKVKMMNSCYTFLTVTACAVLYMSKDAKAMIGGGRNVGKVGARVQSLAGAFGGVKSSTINYGSIGQPRTGSNHINYLDVLRPSTGTLDGGSRLPQTGSTGTGGFSSGLTGIRGTSNLTSSVKLNVGGEGTQFATSKMSTQTGGSGTGGLGATVTSKGIGAGTSSSSRLTGTSSSSVRTMIYTSTGSSSSSSTIGGGAKGGVGSRVNYDLYGVNGGDNNTHTNVVLSGSRVNFDIYDSSSSSGDRNTLGRRRVSYTSSKGNLFGGKRYTSTLRIDIKNEGGKAVATKVIVSDIDYDTVDVPPKYKGYVDKGYGEADEDLTQAMKDLEDAIRDAGNLIKPKGIQAPKS